MSKAKSRKQKKQHHRSIAVIGPAPYLVKKSVTLEDIYSVSGSTSSGYVAAIVNGNGIAFSSLPTATRVPQKALWDQYAGMFEYYQVKRIELKFVPFRFQGSGTATAQSVILPSISCLTPDSTSISSATIPDESAYFSFGNANIKMPYVENCRHIGDYTNLAICKQDNTILKTNGSSASREVYQNPASIQMLVQAPSFGTTIVGYMVFKIHYVFSGQKAPGVQMPAPSQIKGPDIVESLASAEQVYMSQLLKAMKDIDVREGRSEPPDPSVRQGIDPQTAYAMMSQQSTRSSTCNKE